MATGTDLRGAFITTWVLSNPARAITGVPSNFGRNPEENIQTSSPAPFTKPLKWGALLD